MASSSSSAAAASQVDEAVLAEQKKEYEALCRRINLDSENQRLAWGLLEKFYKTGHGSDGSRVWPICALFLIFSKSLPSLSAPSPYISLSQLLRDANLRIMDFFDPLDTFIGAAFQEDSDGRQACEMSAKNIQLRFVTISVIYRKYQKLFDEFFIRDKLGLSTGRSPVTSTGRKRFPPNSGDATRLFHFGWLLFLVARGKILNQGPPDFLKLVYLLLCCVDLLLIHAPESVRKIPLSELTIPMSASPLGSHRQDTLARLCTKKDIHYAAVKEFHERVFLTFITTHVQLGVLNAEPDHPQGSHHFSRDSASRDPVRDLLPANALYLPGLMDSCLDQNYRNLDREYGSHLQHSCDFDERLYLQNHPQLQTPMKGAGSDMSSTITSPAQLLSPPSAAGSPTGPMTPIKATMNATSWLHKVVLGGIGEGNSTPKDTLERLEKQVLGSMGQPNPLSEIKERAQTLLAKMPFGPADTEARRRDETLALYFRLLDHIVTAEQKRLATSSATPSAKNGLLTLVRNDKFHKSLLASAVEIVMCCYNFPMAATPHEFPAVLRHFEVSSYDFGKVVESVVRHEPSMPRSVVKHLVHIEERVLEQLAWEAGSPLYEALNKPEEREALLARLNESGSPQHPVGSACSVFSTPIKSEPLPEGAAPHKTTSLDLFLRKAAHLMSLRVKKLCEDLQLSLPYLIPDKLIRQLEYALLYIATQTDLMLNRHMDVMMMCSIYSLAKVSIPQLLQQQQPVTFKLIIEKYHLQPQARVSVYKYVRVGDNLDEDVIKFYNKMFLPQLEKFLLGFAPPPPSASGPDSPVGSSRGGQGVKRATRFQEQQLKQAQEKQLLQLQQQQQQLKEQQKQARQQSLLQQISSPISFDKPGRRTPSSSAASVKSPVKVGNVYLSPLRPTAPATPLMLNAGTFRVPGVGPSQTPLSAGSAGMGGRLIFQFGMSPHRQLEQINKSVNRDIAARKKLNFDNLSEAPSSPGMSSVHSPSSSQEVPVVPERRRGAKRKLDLDDDVEGTPPPSAKRSKHNE